MITLMRSEALEAASVVEEQFSENQQLFDEVAQYLNLGYLHTQVVAHPCQRFL